MQKIYIKTTESCNLHCQHCYIGDNRKKTNFFDEEETINWLKKHIVDEKDTLISFHGGEPFLCNLDKLEAITQAFPHANYDATTNLMIITDDILSFIKKHFYRNDIKKPFLKTSWDYKIRFTTDTQLAIWENNVSRVINSGIQLRVITCLTTELVKHVTPQQYIKYITSLGIKDIDFERLTSNTTDDKSLIPGYQEIDNWLCCIYDCKPKDLRIEMFSNLQYAVKGYFLDCRKRECMCNTFTINADGTIGGCPNSSIKNYFASLTSDIDMQKRSYLMLKEQIRHPECYTCKYYKICNGDCHQLSWQGNTCPGMKKLMEKIINDVA